MCAAMKQTHEERGTQRYKTMNRDGKRLYNCRCGRKTDKFFLRDGDKSHEVKSKLQRAFHSFDNSISTSCLQASPTHTLLNRPLFTLCSGVAAGIIPAPFEACARQISSYSSVSQPNKPSPAVCDLQPRQLGLSSACSERAVPITATDPMAPKGNRYCSDAGPQEHSFTAMPTHRHACIRWSLRRQLGLNQRLRWVQHECHCVHQQFCSRPSFFISNSQDPGPMPSSSRDTPPSLLLQPLSLCARSEISEPDAHHWC